MANSKDNNWGGMAPSNAKISTSKSVASTLKNKTATNTAKAKAAPVQYYRGGTTTPNTIDFGKIINDYASGVQQRLQSGTADTGKLPTPATAGIVKPSVGVPAYLAKPTPTGTTTTTTPSAAAGGAKPAASKSLTDLLRVPGINAIYNPILEQLQAQQDAASKRYESNAANLKNIFGALSGLAAADKLKIQEQYAQSLAAASGALEQRKTAANEATAAGVAQAQATGAERGAGPGMATNPIQTATVEGNTRADAYQTTWDNLQRANEAQAIESAKSRGEGYNQQQVAAITGLQQSLEDRLMQIGGNTAQVQSDIASAKFGQETNIAQAKYAEAVAARNAAIAAANSQASAQAKALRDMPVINKIRMDLTTPRFNALVSQIDKAYGIAAGVKNPVGSTKGFVAPTASDVVSAWITNGGNRDLIDYANKYAKEVYNK